MLSLATYIATYSVVNREIMVIVDDTKPLTEYTNGQHFLYIEYSTLTMRYTQVVLDLTQIILKEPKLDLTQSVAEYLTTLTEMKVNGYTTTKLPLKDISTGKYLARLESYDGFGNSDLTVAYTSITQPAVRNDIYQKHILSDLVITPTHRNLANSLVSVNGVFHKTTLADNGELFVKDGFSNIMNVNATKLGIFDTTTLGGHSIIPLTLANIDNTTMQDPSIGVTMTFPDVDFTNKTILLVVGGYLYMFDDTYHVIGTNRLKIDICKMDIVNQYIHNPNTPFHETYSVPPGYDDLVSAVDVMKSGVSRSNYPTLKEMMNTLLTQWPMTESVPLSHTNAMYSFFYTKYHGDVSGAIKYIKESSLADVGFIYSVLVSDHSFIIAIDNPSVYIRSYELHSTMITSQSECMSYDTPRGMLRYNRYMTIPYVLYTSGDKLQHTFSIDYSKRYADVYKSVVGPGIVPAPLTDVQNEYQDLPVTLVEIYAA